MKRKILNILVALALVVGLSLIPAVAMGVVVGEPDAGYRLGDGTGGTAAWSTAQHYTGSYSALLTKTGGAADSTYVDFALTDSGITVADLEDIDTSPEWSFYYQMIDADGVAGPQLELLFTSADYPTTGNGSVEITLMPLQNSSPTGAWQKKAVLAATERVVYYGTASDGDAFNWETEAGVYGLEDILALIDAETVMGDDSAADWELTRVRMELWETAARTSYIDTVTIAGVTYDLEPVESNVGYTLGDGTSGTAAWSITEHHNGSYSANLTKAAGTYDSTYVDFIPTGEVTLADFGAADSDPEWSWWHHTAASQYNWSQMELRFTAPDGDADIVLDITAMPLQNYLGTGAWVQQSLVQATTGLLYYGTDAAGTGYSWTTGGDSVLKTVGGIIAAIEANTTCADSNAVLEALVLTRVRIEVWDAEATKTSYIDDVTIAGTNYDLEPIVMDKAFYNTGGTVNVSVYNGYASGTLSGNAYSDSTGADYPITYHLTETSTDVFTSSFDLGDGDDELLVNEYDTIYVKCTANWGAGAQTLTWSTTAIIDDTDPEIAIVSPAASANITDNTTAIAATLTDDVSGIDVDTIVMTLDDDEVEAAYDAHSGALTYTSDELSDGTYTVAVDVSDIAGNAATESWSFTVDTVDPVITDQVAEPPVVIPDEETEVVFTATVTDATSGVATVTIDLTGVGGEVTDMLDDGELDDVEADDGIYTATADITESDEDSYDLPVTATDEAGNAATENITLVVSSDIEAPVITDPAITYPAGYSSARPGDNVTISATVIDDVLMGTVTADNSDAFAAPVNLLDNGVAPDDTASDDIYTGTVEVVAGTAAGDYTVTITATDAEGNEATDDSLTLIVSSVITSYDIDLVEGWNLISTPLIPDDSDIDVILADITDNVSSVWSYDVTTGEWLYYEPDGPGDLTDIVDGQGYWIEMTADNTLTISGVELPAPPETPPAYSVYEGWNLIGFKSVDAMVASAYFGTAVTADFVRMYGYDAVDAIYTTILTGDSLQPGQGYWLAVSDDGTIYP